MAFFDRVPTGDLVTPLGGHADDSEGGHEPSRQRHAGDRHGDWRDGLVYTSWPLALVSLSTLPWILLAARYFGRSIRDRQKHVQELLSESTGVAEGLQTFGQFDSLPQNITNPCGTGKDRGNIQRGGPCREDPGVVRWGGAHCGERGYIGHARVWWKHGSEQ